MSNFVVRESIDADYVSRHATREDALAVIEQMVAEGAAEPGEFNVRQIDAAGKTIRVFGPEDGATSSR